MINVQKRYLSKPQYIAFHAFVKLNELTILLVAPINFAINLNAFFIYFDVLEFNISKSANKRIGR